MDQPLYKLTQQSWPVFFQEGSMAFHLFSGSAIPEEMAGYGCMAPAEAARKRSRTQALQDDAR
jgi:hypothetical protein